MKNMKARTIIAACMIAAFVALAGCTQSGTQSSSAGSSAGSGPSAASTSAASASAASAGTVSASTESPTAAAPDVNEEGKQLITGTVICTTFKERAAETGFAGSDFANDEKLLTLLVLDNPIEVTAYKGGGDYTGEVSVIRLPDDEMFRQFKDKSITIGVDSWGAFPADITAALYDLILTFDEDGLVLVQ